MYDVKTLSEEQLYEVVVKANKWDALDEKIGTFYPEDTDEELPFGEFDENSDGLISIGEAAAMAFGYL